MTSDKEYPLVKIADYEYLLPKDKGMKTEGLIFSDDKMIEIIRKERSALQLAGVASLPGIIGRALAMPDIHYGYGFPIGGVAAFDLDEGIISPGGIGYDINCGVRLLKTNIRQDSFKGPDIKRINDLIFNKIPSGVGESGNLRLSLNELKKILENGAAAAVAMGFGDKRDLSFIEDGGCLEGGDPKDLSERALKRGLPQLGTLGAGNHFIELQEVEEVLDHASAGVFKLSKDYLYIMLHTGSRGLGYQVCDDYIRLMLSASRKYNISLPDRQLASAPFKSDEGKRYYSAMLCAANYAFANRQAITYLLREAFREAGLNSDIELIYDLCHNVGKVEEDRLVHRKGATRALGPGSKLIPECYSETGQPVLLPGSMGTRSFVMRGLASSASKSFSSASHGAGRIWSRSRALKEELGGDLMRRLEKRGVYVAARSLNTLAEESPSAYKDIERVARVTEGAKLAAPVAKLRPLAVVKG